MSPYTYCYNNPLKFIDPTGMKGEGVDNDYKLLKNGKLELIKETNDNFDRIYNEDKSKNIKVDKGFINNNLRGKKSSYFVTTNINQANTAYKFFADNTNSEFSLSIFSKNKKNVAVIQTSFSKESISNPLGLQLGMLKKDGFSLKYHSHSHPGKLDINAGYWPAYPSGFHSDFTINQKEEGDRDFYQSLHRDYSNKIPQYFDIYVPSAPEISIKYNNIEVIRK